METKEDYEVAKTVAKYKSRARNLYRLMCDGRSTRLPQVEDLTSVDLEAARQRARQQRLARKKITT